MLPKRKTKLNPNPVKKSYDAKFKIGEFEWNFVIADRPEWDTQQERYAAFAKIAADFVETRWSADSILSMEDYAFSATGRAYQIAESAQSFKGEIWRRFAKEPILLKPNVLKQFATTSGGATKTLMAESFFKQRGFRVNELMDSDNPETNPSSDIVDAYFAASHALWVYNGSVT